MKEAFLLMPEEHVAIHFTSLYEKGKT